jgi:aminopeptidase N
MSLAEGESAWPDTFLLAAHAKIKAVTVNGLMSAYEFSHGRLKAILPEASSTLEIRYSILYEDSVPQDVVGIEDPSYGVSATIMPQGTYLSEGSSWHPRAEGVQNIFKVNVIGPKGMTGVTAGRLLDYRKASAETSITWQTEFPQAALALAAGYYTLHKDDFDNIQLLVFVSQENSHLAAGYLQSIREYLALYQELFGSYPYEKFAVVENFYPTGYGLPGWTLLGSKVIRLPFIRTTSLPHEIAHSWWGNSVEIDYGSGNWAEGLTTYVADYYLKELSDPQEAFEYRRKLLRDYASLVSPEDDLPLNAFRSRMSKRDQAVGYGKSAMVFHMLRELIGDEAFWSALQNVALQGRGKRYGWGDLRSHFEEVAQVDLGDFFEQWITQTGAPWLSLSDVDAVKVASGWQVSGTLQQDGKLYALAVPLRLVTENRSYEQVVGLYEDQDCFLFTVTDPPRSLTVDPDSQLFRRLYAQEIPATVNDLRASKAQLIVVAKGSESLLPASHDLLRGLQWHQSEIVNEADFIKSPARDRDILFLGWPQSEALQPEMPEELSSYEHKLDVPHELSEGNPGVFFMVNKSASGDHLRAYFLPGSVFAAKDVARRISHYGRYSYLFFRDGKNLSKATWKPNDSPLKFILKPDGAS